LFSDYILKFFGGVKMLAIDLDTRLVSDLFCLQLKSLPVDGKTWSGRK